MPRGGGGGRGELGLLGLEERAGLRLWVLGP